MADKKLFGMKDMETVERRLAAMGRELYQLIEDYPVLVLPGLGYFASLAFWHERIKDEVIALKRVTLAKKR